jgi:hypothetical protein
MKIFFSFLLVASIGLNIYLLSKTERSHVVKSITSKASISDEINSIQSSIRPSQKKARRSKAKTIVKSSKKSKRSQVQKESTSKLIEDEELLAKKEFHYYRALWTVESDMFLMEELKLSHSQVEVYRELAAAREIEIDEYFNPKVVGESKNSLYIPTTEDKIFIANLSKKYDELLKENFSEEDFFRYREFVRDYNQKLSQEDTFYPIEF